MASDSSSFQTASTYHCCFCDSILTPGNVAPPGSLNRQLQTPQTNEKVEPQHLNDHLTNYIEKVRLLEEQNQALAAQVKQLQGRKLTAYERLMEQTPQYDVESNLTAFKVAVSESTRQKIM